MSTRDSTGAADYWHGQADAFLALAGMKSTVSPGLLGWAQAQARLALQAAERAEGES